MRILKKLGGVAVVIVIAIVFFVVRSKGEEGQTVIRVASVGKAEAKCANPAQPLAYPKRGTTLCIVPNA